MDSLKNLDWVIFTNSALLVEVKYIPAERVSDTVSILFFLCIELPIVLLTQNNQYVKDLKLISRHWTLPMLGQCLRNVSTRGWVRGKVYKGTDRQRLLWGTPLHSLQMKRVVWCDGFQRSCLPCYMHIFWWFIKDWSSRLCSTECRNPQVLSCAFPGTYVPEIWLDSQRWKSVIVLDQSRSFQTMLFISQ